MTMSVLSGRSVTFCSLLDLLLNGTIKIKVAEFDWRWFIVALLILIGNKFKIFNYLGEKFDVRFLLLKNRVWSGQNLEAGYPFRCPCICC
jgi:hypothetical protein